jgi:hypothetical protein
MSLIDMYDPNTAARIREDVRWLLFTDAPGGSYLAGVRAIRIGIGYARRASELELAMMIVHELTHAALYQQGMRYRSGEREQIEKICVGAEIAFARCVPHSESAIAKAEALLATAWWDAEKAAPDTIRDLVDRGVPGWLAKLIVRRSIRKSGTV